MKSKKITIGSSILLATATAVAIPIAINQTKENTDLQYNESKHISNPNTESFYNGSSVEASTKNKTFYDGAKPIIDDSRGTNYIER
ncbi:hypothetical protein, partial [Mycoplasma marinum]